MGYTPAASRSGYHERGEEKTSSNNNQIIDGRKTPPPPTSEGGGGGMLLSRSSHNNNSSNSIRDVEVRSRPVEYSSAMVETFFACTGPGAMNFVDKGEGGMNGRDTNNPKRMMSQGSSSFRGSSTRDSNGTTNAAGIAEVAAYVAAGGILPPGGILEAASTMTRQLQTSSMNSNTGGGGSSRRLSLADTPKNFTPCPTLPQDELLLEWNSLSSLARSMAYQSSGSYCETTYIQSGGPFERITKYNGEEHTVGGEAPFTPTECMGMIWSIANSGVSSTSPKASPVVVAAEDVFDAHLLQLLGVAISPKMGVVEKGQRLSEMLLDIVIDIALNDINLCQRLFFLLRSFIGELEEQKVPHGYISEQSALAMRCCRYAQRRLSGRMFDKSVGSDGEKERHCSEGYPISRESSRTKQQVDFSKLSIAASESSIHHNTNGTLSSLGMDDNINLRETGAVQELTESSSDLPGAISSSSLIDQTASISQSEEQDGGVVIQKKKKKSKKILRMLKGGKSKKASSSDQSSAAPSTITGVASGESSKKSPKSSSKSFFPKFSKSASLETIDDATPPVISVSNDEPESISLSSKFENMASILRQLDNSCSTIERNLMKSFSQKMADWALYPWSESKESALASVTQSFRSELRLMNPRPGSSSSSKFPILNPVDSTELLTSVDADECFILPSAHFPLLLCFNSEYNVVGSPKACAISSSSQEGGGTTSSRVDTLYRTKVEVVGLHSTLPPKVKEAFSIQGGIAGVVQESGVR